MFETVVSKKDRKMLGTKHCSIRYTFKHLQMAGNKSLPKEDSNWLLSLELDRRQKMYYSVLQLGRFLPKK